MPIIDHKNLKIVVSIALINNENEILLSKRPEKEIRKNQNITIVDFEDVSKKVNN